MKVRITRLLAFLVISFIVVAAGSAFGAGAVKINFWAGFTGPDKLGMQKIVDAFKAKNPDIQVEFFTAPWTEVFTKFTASFGSASAPDLLVMHISDIPQFADRKMLTPVESLLQQMNVRKDDYPAAVWAGQSYAGKQYGVPLDFHPMSVFNNVKMYRAAGLDPNKPFTSKDQFVSAMKKLTKGDQYGLAIGVPHGHNMRYWYGLLYQAGGTFLNADQTKAAFATEAGFQALQFLSDLVHVYKVVPFRETDIDRDWLSGRVASLIEGPWWVPGATDQGLEFATVPFPKIFGQSGTWAGAHTLTLPQQGNKARKDAAVKLMQYIAANSVEWGAAGQIPASISVINSQAYKSLPTYKQFTPFIQESGFIHFEPIIKANAQFGADNQLSPVLNAVDAVILGEKKPREALMQAAADVDRILAH